MAVYIKTALWPGTIPYLAADPFSQNHIALFNQTVRKAIFVPRTSENDYVEFKTGGHAKCVIGRKGGKQILNCEPTTASILHEMGHCVGLGHENFHTGWPARSLLVANTNRSLHADGYRLNMAKYTDLGSFDRHSLMLYGPTAFQISMADYNRVARLPFIPPNGLSQLDIVAIRQLYAGVSDL